jgi:hypothetical protein
MREILLTLALFIGWCSMAQESPEVERLEEEMHLAESRIRALSFWMRLRPTLTFTAGLGLNNALIYDPSSAMLLPRDSYRLTLSIPLHEIWTGEKETEAVIRQKILLTELRGMREKRDCEMEARNRRRRELEQELKVLRSELSLLRDIVRYNELLYRDGSLTFDALARARLQVLGAERQLLHAESQLAEY